LASLRTRSYKRAAGGGATVPPADPAMVVTLPDC
jgi:hypothetical protein